VAGDRFHRGKKWSDPAYVGQEYPEITFQLQRSTEGGTPESVGDPITIGSAPWTYTLAAFGIAKLVSERGAGLRRLERFSKPETKPKPEAAGIRGADDGKKRKYSINELTRSILTVFGKAFEGKEYTSKIEMELARADIPLRGSEFVGLNLILVLVGAAYGWLVLGHVLAGLILALVGGFLPNLYVKSKQGARLARFDSQIADALVIMSNSLRAGYSFLQAMDMVAREMSPPDFRGIHVYYEGDEPGLSHRNCAGNAF